MVLPPPPPPPTIMLAPLKLQPGYLLVEFIQTAKEAWPEVPEEWPVYLLQALLGAGIHTDIQLGHGHKIPVDNQGIIREARGRAPWCWHPQ